MQFSLNQISIVEIYSKTDLINDPSVRKLVIEQTVEWSSLMEKHRKQEWEFLRNQLNDQRELLRKHMELLQQQQMRQLEAKHEKDLKEMNSQQAKIAVETAREVSFFNCFILIIKNSLLSQTYDYHVI